MRFTICARWSSGEHIEPLYKGFDTSSTARRLTSLLVSQLGIGLEADMNDPVSLKDGDYLDEQVLSHSREVLQADRNGLIAALRDWLSERSDPRTMLAAHVIADLGLVELKPELVALRDEILEGKALPHLSPGGRRFYLRRVTAYISALA